MENGEWRMENGLIWSMEYGVWTDLEYGVWSMEYGEWTDLEYGIWTNLNLENGLIWSLEYGRIWNMKNRLSVENGLIGVWMINKHFYGTA